MKPVDSLVPPTRTRTRTDKVDWPRSGPLNCKSRNECETVDGWLLCVFVSLKVGRGCRKNKIQRHPPDLKWSEIKFKIIRPGKVTAIKVN